MNDHPVEQSLSNNDVIRILYIKCGLEHGLENKNSKNLFWPVAKAIYLNVSIEPSIFKSNFSLVFSSKTSVLLFYKHVFKKHPDFFDRCIAIYFVGLKTKECFEHVFDKDIYNQNIFYSKHMGMKNLITEFKLNHTVEPLVFFIAESGKSREIIEAENFYKSPILFFIYRLEINETNFLDKIFNKNQLIDSRSNNYQKNIIFECCSGNIFEFSVLLLMKHFKCSHILELPKKIQFLCLGASAQEKREYYYGQCRCQK